ncbi:MULTISPECIES: D-alanyl-D-alanine carboxypeptidase family protein [Thiomicrorhabdus]|uniref:serine-type D-Ala-D-Ala carboxypeptidase n=1 Tax=Thiomicrorhabdus heinhorstiae TaxID=2748010 RepID=A0ABS0BVQ9_9GAMM|nr:MULTISPECIES: D-alanyl-D-alanine carboxypeptidase family protein [Thiomicrorhabdus]MBF6057158.1 D-alanyl-D-alanine carboxypeptidase [Thiomicrorhabdus heinhorstiae]
MQYLAKLFTLFVLLFSTPSFAEPIPTPTPLANPPIPHVVPSPPAIAGKAYLLIDINSGYVLASKEPDKPVEPASLTKIMTGYVVINELRNGNLHLDDMVSISQKAWKMPGSKMFIEVGKQVSVHDLIKGMVIQSGNDASVALAEHIAGSEEVFAQLMNKYAKSLGMTGTHYVNATGLPNPDHYTTARDLAILTKALITKFPEEYEWYSQKKFTYNGITQYNRNKLLWQDPTVDGLKTGHTESAGYCLVSSAKREDMRLISVILGTASAKMRIQETQKLLNYGFRFFETHKLYNAQQRLNDVKVWEGTRDLIGIGLKDDLYVTIPRGQYKNLKIESSIQPQIKAPIQNLQELGTLHVSLGDKTLVERPLVALADVEEGSFFKKVLDQLKLFFRSLFSFLD